MTIRISPARTSLFDRLGGLDTVDIAVGRLFERLGAEAAFAPLGRAGKNPDTRWQVQMLLTDIFGGPMAYDGPEPREIAERLGLDAAKVGQLIGHVAASFAGVAGGGGLAAEISARLGEFAALSGYTPAESLPAGDHPAAATVSAAGPSTQPAPLALSGLVAEAEHVAAEAGLADWNLFLLDPHLTVVHASPAAVRAAATCEGDLRRAFNLGAGLSGTSMLQFHSTPTHLQAILSDPARLPHETTWSFGQAVWTARIHALRGADRGLLGYAVLWRDESAAYQAQAAQASLLAAPEPAAREPAGSQPVPPEIGPPVGTAAAALREEARELAASAGDLQRLVRLLESAADHVEGQVHLSGPGGEGPLPEAARLAESAIAALRTAREASQAPGRREAVHRALETITGFARRTNQLALDAALLAVQEDASQAAAELREDARALAQGLRDRVRALEARTQSSTDLLRQSMTAAARLAQLRAELGQEPDTP